MVLDDLSDRKPLDDLPCFHAIINHSRICGDPYALAMNAGLIEKIASSKNYPELLFLNMDEVAPTILAWLEEGKIERITPAGKNYAYFDSRFLEKLPGFDAVKVKFDHRSLDPAVLYWQPEDIKLPDSKTCMVRAGINGEVSHTALEDAMMVVKLIRGAL